MGRSTKSALTQRDREALFFFSAQLLEKIFLRNSCQWACGQMMEPPCRATAKLRCHEQLARPGLIKVSDRVPSGPSWFPGPTFKLHPVRPTRLKPHRASKTSLHYKNPGNKTAFALITASEQAGVGLEEKRTDRSALIAFQLVMGSHVVGRETLAAANFPPTPPPNPPPPSALRDTHYTDGHRRDNSLASQCRTIGMEMGGCV